MGFFGTFLSLFIQILSTLLMVYCVMSWFVPPDFPVRKWLDGYMDQLLDPIRNFLPSMGGFDFSPVILMLILQVIQRILSRF